MNILIAGDFCDRYRVSPKIRDKDFEGLFGIIRPLVNKFDYSVVNFEFPIVQTIGKPIKKSGPHLAGQLLAIDAIKYAGFKCCTLANNHTLDQGEDCGLDTKVQLENAGFDVVGFGINKSESSKILYRPIKGERLAIINCCEHEFSVATENSAGSNGLNVVQQYYDIKEARENADYVIVIVHGGHEHFNLPSPRMKETYRFFIDAGADVVVNHHQHCYSGYEIYNNKPIFYGLGNLLFDNPAYRNSFWNEGYMVGLNLSKDKITFELHPYTQCNDDPVINLLGNQDEFLYRIDKLNKIITDDQMLLREVETYYSNCEKWELATLEPYQNKLLFKLYSLGVLPSVIKGEKLSVILNHVDCESHRDKLLFALKQKNK